MSNRKIGERFVDSSTINNQLETIHRSFAKVGVKFDKDQTKIRIERLILFKYMEKLLLECKSNNSESKIIINFVNHHFTRIGNQKSSNLLQSDTLDDLIQNIVNDLFEITCVTKKRSGDSISIVYKILMGSDKIQKLSAYYTDRKLCEYMVNQVLEMYTCGKINQQFDTNFSSLHEILEQNIDIIKYLADLILNLKLLDPAVGSGNFIITSLHKLYEIHLLIREKFLSLTKNDTYQRKTQEPSLESNFSIYFSDKAVFSEEILTHIVSGNLFASDIDQNAILVLKLRLIYEISKLSTIDKNIFDAIMNTTNFQTGDSLMKSGNQLFNSQKHKLIRWDNIKGIFDRNNPGFDIIIGNPPYLSHTNISKYYGEKYKKYLFSNYSPSKRSYDLSLYFSLKSFDILRDNGCLAFLTSNKWLKSSYGSSFRSFIAQNLTVTELVDTSKLSIFQNLSVDTIIYFVKNHVPKSSDIDVCFPETMIQLNHHEINRITIERRYLGQNPWNLHSDKYIRKVIDTMDNFEKRLNNYCNIYRGVTTGLNKIFIINSETKNRLIQEDIKNKEIIKPIISGKDVKKYFIKNNNKWIIFTKQGINIEKYPRIKKYLSQYQDQLKPKPPGHNGEWKGRKKGNYKWFEIQDSTEYYLEFEKPKIFSNKAGKVPSFALDLDNLYSKNTTYILTTDRKHLLAYLNSSVALFYLKHKFTRLGNNFEPKKKELIELPVPNFPQDYIDVLNLLAGFSIFLTRNEEIREETRSEIEYIQKELIDNLLFELLLMKHKQVMKQKLETGILCKHINEIISSLKIDGKSSNNKILNHLDNQKISYNTVKSIITKLQENSDIREVTTQIKSHPYIQIIMDY